VRPSSSATSAAEVTSLGSGMPPIYFGFRWFSVGR
jgi:hypothetical protein